MVSAPVLVNPTFESAVELDDYYSTFFEVEVPTGTSAIRAWQGVLQPFKNDECACDLLHAFENGIPILSDRATLFSKDGHVKKTERWAEPFLVSMAERFQVLILEYDEPHHPVAFSVRPEISGYRFPGHPHLRRDIFLQYGGRTLHGLCVYSAADFVYRLDIPRIVQFVDQVSGYLGRHLIWERTRRLLDSTGRVIYQPKAGEPIFDTEPRIQEALASPTVNHPRRYMGRVWHGYWPGKSAPSGPARHVATIRPNQECWCGSGKKYRLCHLRREL
jgi:hypothetical protein